jgi:polyphenol oxidase
MLSPIEAENLRRLPGIRHGFFTSEGGVSSGIYAGLNCGLGSHDDPALVTENRRRVASHLGADHGGVVTLYQVHGATALRVTGPVPRTNLPKADAVVTSTPKLAIGVLTADCTPVLFADATAGVVGAAHAGWRGAVAGILESTITEMERLGARRAQIRAAIGPTISQDAYEVGPEFEAEVVALDPAYARYFSCPAPGARAHFDLPGFVAGQLTAGGVGSIELATACTRANESKFFSYRRSQALKEADYGRQISAIVVA